VTMERRVEELKRIYPEVSTKTLQDGSYLVRVCKVGLPKGCNPETTDVLLSFQLSQEVPSGRYVKDQVRLPNGKTPGYNATTIDGETWYGFSYNFLWNGTTDPMYQYVESMLTRFAKSE
jgi:hypothetical protein